MQLTRLVAQIEGISSITDLNDGPKVHVIDTYIAPMPPHVAELFYKNDPNPMNPVNTELNNASRISILGHQISWQGWSFHASIHPREGLVISALSLKDNNRMRSILHRASLSEMVVPYADTDEHWYWKSAFDEGEYGLGTMTTSLNPGVHAPKNAHYLDAILADNDGNAVSIPKALAVFERDSGILWSHHDADANKTVARAGKELIVLHFITIGNYDYGMQWIFKEDGSVELQMLLTGVIAVKANKLAYCARCRDNSDEDQFGNVIDTNLLGISHQHFFNFRLDFALDGINNQVAEIDFEPIASGKNNPHGNAFVVKKNVITSENVSGRTTDEAKCRRWLVYNPNIKNRLGHFPGFMLIPGVNTTPFANADSSTLIRAPFLKKNLFVTEYHPDEMYAAGDFPSQGQGDGVTRWIERDASLVNRSVVVWYTFGLTHLPCAEEWPIMPVTKAGFHLRPMGFFDRNHLFDSREKN